MTQSSSIPSAGRTAIRSTALTVGLAGPWLKWLRCGALVVFALAHLYGISAPPNGFHLWRESDTAMVAENFATESMDFFQPRVHVRGTGTGIVGMELPVYGYASALLYRAFGFSHVWPRLLSTLGGLLMLLGLERVFRRLSGDPLLAVLGLYMAAFAPLVAFYSVKIQPDTWALAATVWGFVGFGRWLDGPRQGAAAWRAWLLTVACLALAGSIKPTFLFVGLPMLYCLWQRDGVRGVVAWPHLLLGAVILTPIALWFKHARALTEAFGSAYFYLGGEWATELAGLFSPLFYQHLLLTWPWELAAGVPGTVLILYAFGHRRALAGGMPLLFWLAGCYVTFVLAAQHCATPHDYYYLPAVPVFAFGAAAGARWMLGDPRRWVRGMALGLLLIVPVYGYGRMRKRYDLQHDFAGVRAAVQTAVAANGTAPGLAVAVDGVPGYLLYRAGLHGWHVTPDAAAADLPALQAQGARYVLVRRQASLPQGLAALVGPALVSADDVVLLPLLAPPG